MTFPPNGWQQYQGRRGAIANILDPRCYTIEWLDTMVVNGDALVFASKEAVIVMAVKQYPAGATELHGLVCVGDMNAALLLLDEAEAWANQQRVTFSCVASREGWRRVLKDRGYSLYQTELRKEL